MEEKKYKKGEVSCKKRNLYYSSHRDRFIYSYYSHVLNEKYNIYTEIKGINHCAIAYRTNLKKNNIDFAHDAFNFISKNKCLIMVGDFSNFFDNLYHKYLKDKICKLLNTSKLPDDIYYVFKNITKYSYVEIQHILNINNLNPKSKYSIKKLNKKDIAVTKEQFKSSIQNNICVNDEEFGIPQGSPISAILSNIYMIDFDEEIKNIVEAKNGKYMRYSDDFIIIIPLDEDMKKYQEIFKIVIEKINEIPGLTIQENKTKYFFHTDKSIKNLKINNDSFDIENYSKIDYLGFTFNGNNINIREKTINKFYKKMYKAIKLNIKHNRDKSYYKIYERFGNTKINDNTKKFNHNFMSYVKKAYNIFYKNKNIKKLFERNKNKIKKRINFYKNKLPQ